MNEFLFLLFFIFQISSADFISYMETPAQYLHGFPVTSLPEEYYQDLLDTHPYPTLDCINKSTVIASRPDLLGTATRP